MGFTWISAKGGIHMKNERGYNQNPTPPWLMSDDLDVIGVFVCLFPL